MGEKYLLDSNTIIDYTSRLLPASAMSEIDVIINEKFITSIVVKIEVLGFNGPKDKMKQLGVFIGLAEVTPLNDTIADQTIELRKKHKKLGLGDAIIAATALVYNFTIITRNTTDFKNIDKLRKSFAVVVINFPFLNNSTSAKPFFMLVKMSSLVGSLYSKAAKSLWCFFSSFHSLYGIKTPVLLPLLS
jgi:predicted nucleic acid-binding protein